MTIRTKKAVLADAVLFSSPRERNFAREVSLVLGGALAVALLARLEIRLPFSPVPITGQTLGVLLAGALLGSRRAFAAMLLYLASGLAGAPVFAGGGAGPAWILGPTGGYLAGFPAAAWTAGFLAERGWDRSWKTALPAMAAGNVVLYLFGLPWLAAFVGPSRAPLLGLYPFLAGDVVKILLAGAVLPAGWKFLGKNPSEDGETEEVSRGEEIP